MLLAEELGAEIVAADSMQVYKGMDIGTAKPTPEERARVPHHLVDVVSLKESFDVALYRRLATQAIADIQQRGRLPLVVGGSGMYLRALTEGLFQVPPLDSKLRSELELQPAEMLHDRLKQVDPAAATRIGRQNKRRLVRALEVFQQTGKPISALQVEWAHARPARPTMIFLERDRDDLYRRIEHRVDWMFAHGLVEETQRLLANGLVDNPVAGAAAGYREVAEMLRGAARTLEETILKTKQRTRQLAKRQLTWFRHQARLRRVQAGATAEQTKERVRELVENARG